MDKRFSTSPTEYWTPASPHQLEHATVCPSGAQRHGRGRSSRDLLPTGWQLRRCNVPRPRPGRPVLVHGRRLSVAQPAQRCSATGCSPPATRAVTRTRLPGAPAERGEPALSTRTWRWPTPISFWPWLSCTKRSNEPCRPQTSRTPTRGSLPPSSAPASVLTCSPCETTWSASTGLIEPRGNYEVDWQVFRRVIQDNAIRRRLDEIVDELLGDLALTSAIRTGDYATLTSCCGCTRGRKPSGLRGRRVTRRSPSAEGLRSLRPSD